MKQFLGVCLAMVFLVVSAQVVSASEGVFNLVGPSEEGGACFAASVYVDGNYRVLMTCRGLRMALDPVKNKYVVWANVAERKQRLGEVVNGKLSANVASEFESLFVTLEPDSYGSRPTGVTVMTGSVAPIDFGKGTFDAGLGQSVTPVVTSAPVDSRGGVTPVTPSASGRLTNVVVGIGKAVLFGFILLLIVVGVMSFLARRKNL